MRSGSCRCATSLRALFFHSSRAFSCCALSRASFSSFLLSQSHGAPSHLEQYTAFLLRFFFSDISSSTSCSCACYCSKTSTVIPGVGGTCGGLSPGPGHVLRDLLLRERRCSCTASAVRVVGGGKGTNASATVTATARNSGGRQPRTIAFKILGAMALIQ